MGVMGMVMVPSEGYPGGGVRRTLFLGTVRNELMAGVSSLKAAVAGSNTVVGTGKSFIPYGPVSEKTEKLDVLPTGQIKTEMRIKINSKTAHLLSAIDIEYDFKIKLKSKTDFKAALDAKNTAATASTFSKLDPFFGLANIKLNPNPARANVDYWVLKHNTTEAIKMEKQSLDVQGDMQYSDAEIEFNHGLENGYVVEFEAEGVLGAQQYYYDELWGERAPNATDPQTTLRFGRFSSRRATEKYRHTGATTVDNSPTRQPLAGKAFPSQIAQLKARHQGVILEDSDLARKYRQNFYHEICLRDLSRQKVVQTGAYPQDAGYDVRTSGNGKDTEDIANIWGGKEYTFRLTHRLQTPWHRHAAHAFPVLNCMNDPEFIITMLPSTQWIQNWAEVAHLIDDITIDNAACQVKYYDIPRPLWDSMFPVSQQKSYFMSDIRKSTHELAQLTFTGSGNWDTREHVKQHTQTKKISLTEHDKLIRMFVVEVQPQAWTTHKEKAPSLPTIDYFSEMWVEVSNTILEKYSKGWQQAWKDHYTHFARDKNSVRERWVLTLGVDGDIDNVGGGSIDFAPIFNNAKIGYTLNTGKVERYATHPDLRPIYANVATVDDGPVSDFYGNWCTDGLGSIFGAIGKRDTDPGQTSFTYDVTPLITVQAVGVSALVFQNGQASIHQQT